MKRIVISAMIIAGSVVLATAQPAKEAYEPGLGEFMTATQLRHATCSLSRGADNAVTMSGAERKIAYVSASDRKRTA